MKQLCPMALLFVYGTLKRGQPNHRVLRDGAHGSATFRARGCTLEPYPLVIAGEHNIPWLLHLPGSGRRVEGEVYMVDERMLRFLDDFESCPTLYQRTALRVQLLEDRAPGTEEPPTPAEAQCFVYSTATFPPEWAQLPHHDSYDSEGPHGLRYNPRENR
nr:gamma-glutamylaminecyclotransferase [Callithrix jacchus]